MINMENRREFLKKGALAAAAAPLLATACKNEPQGDKYGIDPDPSIESKLIVPKGAGLPITGTFLDEISHDIPHQNWGEREWDEDFRLMKAIGIDTVVMIRCGHRKFITPFVGDQITLSDAFGFEIPDGCRPTYTSRKSTKGKRGRPAKPQVETS